MDKKVNILINENESSGHYYRNNVLEHYDKCMLTLSPHKSYTNYTQLKAILEWAAIYFNEILVVHGLFNERWNLIKNSINKEAEITLDIKKSLEKFSRRLNRIFIEVDAKVDIKMHDWEKTLINKYYIQILNDIINYYNLKSDFRDDLIQLAEGYSHSINNISSFEVMDINLKYIFEEISMFIFLFKRGYKIDVYPGKDLQILKNISKGLYKNFPYTLSNRTHISLNLIIDK